MFRRCVSWRSSQYLTPRRPQRSWGAGALWCRRAVSDVWLCKGREAKELPSQDVPAKGIPCHGCQVAVCNFAGAVLPHPLQRSWTPTVGFGPGCCFRPSMFVLHRSNSHRLLPLGAHWLPQADCCQHAVLGTHLWCWKCWELTSDSSADRHLYDHHRLCYGVTPGPSRCDPLSHFVASLGPELC